MSDQSRQTPGWRRIALPVSIIFNLFLVALIGGHLWRRDRGEIDGRPPFARVMERIEASLPPQDAAAVKAVIERAGPKYQDASQQAVAARLEVVRQITAEPFDQDALRQALAKWRVARDHFLDDFGDAFVEALAQVSPEGRRMLALELRPARLDGPSR
jgi:uncharacterized membrane protein